MRVKYLDVVDLVVEQQLGVADVLHRPNKRERNTRLTHNQTHKQQLRVTTTSGDLCCLQCFDAVGWAAGRASGLYKTEW